MRRIDLTALIVSPMVVGALLTYGGSVLAVLVICVWNLLAWAPECALLRYSIQQAPWLTCVLAPNPHPLLRCPRLARILSPCQFRALSIFSSCDSLADVVTSCDQRHHTRVCITHTPRTLLAEISTILQNGRQLVKLYRQKKKCGQRQILKPSYVCHSSECVVGNIRNICNPTNG